MTYKRGQIEKTIQALSPTDKVELVDAIIRQLDRPDPEIESVWIKEAQKRLKAIRSGKTKTIPHSSVIRRLRQRAR